MAVDTLTKTFLIRIFRTSRIDGQVYATFVPSKELQSPGQVDEQRCIHMVNDPEVRMPWLLVHLCLVFGRAGDVFLVTGGLGTALLPRLLGTCSVPTYACKDPWFEVHHGLTVAAGILAISNYSILSPRSLLVKLVVDGERAEQPVEKVATAVSCEKCQSDELNGGFLDIR
jgi:hypothetical protein